MGLFGFGKKEKELCPLCGKEPLGLFNSTVLKDNTSICDKCADKLRTRYNTGEFEYTDAFGHPIYKENGYVKTGIYDDLNSITLEEAKAAFAEESASTDEVLNDLGGMYGTIFRAAGDSYNIAPGALDVGIVRAKKMKNKAVLEGILVSGSFGRDEDAVLIVNGCPKSVKVIEAQRKEIGDLKDTLSANSKKGLKEGQPGWLILDTEEYIPDGAIVAKK